MKKSSLWGLGFALTVAAFSLALADPAAAQQSVKVCIPTGTPNPHGCQDVDATNPLPVTGGGGGGGTSGFTPTPGGAFSPLTVTNVSASAALPIGTTTIFYNYSTKVVSCVVDVGSATATIGMNLIQPGSWIAFVNGTSTFGACINQDGSATSGVVIMSGGSGTPSGSGGGGSGSGGGPATIADCANTVEGCIADPATYAGSGSATLDTIGKSSWVLLNSALAAVGAVIPSKLLAICVDDGTTHCIAPKALTAGVAGASSTDVVSVQGAPVAYPVPIGGSSAAVVGSYCMSSASGTMAAGLGAAAPVYSFRYGGANLAIIRNVWVSAQDITTGFTAGNATFNLFAARSFSASDTGGTAATLTGNNGKLRTSFATTSVADIRIASTATLTAGTRTLDAQPLSTLQQALPTTIGVQIFGPFQAFFNQNGVGNQPLQLANNEGFVVQATVPATGTWVETYTTCWDEMAAF